MHLHQSIIHLLPWVLTISASPLPKDSCDIQWVDCLENIPIAATLLGITVPSTLPSTLKCGELVVPMNYEDPISPSNNITLSIAMHRPENPKGVLFYNGGGGDPNTIVAWQVALGLLDTFDGLLDYDLMMMDTRGTWNSNQLNASQIGLDAISEILQPFPTNQSAFDAVKASSATYIQDVQQWSTPPGIVQYVSAREVAHDYEQIRIALDYEKINFIALSYGTFRANTYAAYYPARVGNFVLDAVVPHNVDPYYGAQTQLAALNRLLFRADAWCLHNSTCPFYGQGKGSVISAYKKVLASAPLPAPNCTEYGGSSTCSTTVTAFDIQLAIANDLESEGVDFPTLLSNINEALQGDGSSFGGSGAVPSNLNIITAGTILVECGDNNYQNTTFEQWNKSLTDALANDPNQIAVPLAWQLQLGCLSWPFPTPPYAPLLTTTPMLLVTSDFDGSAPTEWASLLLSSQAENSVLVVRHGDDHTSFSLTDQPSTAITKEFLRTGVLPKPSNGSEVSVFLRDGIGGRKVLDPYMVVTGERAGDVGSGNLTEAGILP